MDSVSTDSTVIMLGRVVLSDEGLPTASSDSAVESFLKQSLQTELYTEYTIRPWRAGNEEQKL